MPPDPSAPSTAQPQTSPQPKPAEPQMPSSPHTGLQPPSFPGNKILTIDDTDVERYATTITSLESKTNTINIVVKDQNGQILPGVVCVIKNTHGDPVRAAISNILGQILNNIPLNVGMYKISLTKQGHVFPEVIRNIKGGTYPPIEIKAL